MCAAKSWVEFGRFTKCFQMCKSESSTHNMLGNGMTLHFQFNLGLCDSLLLLLCVFIVQKWTQSFSFFLLLQSFHEHIHRTSQDWTFFFLFLPRVRSFVFSNSLIVVVFYIYFCYSSLSVARATSSSTQSRHTWIHQCAAPHLVLSPYAISTVDKNETRRISRVTKYEIMWSGFSFLFSDFLRAGCCRPPFRMIKSNRH